ncbi:hypothetical protein MLD38_000957 [Melastoma candidum]|uniref:Uncharacterized protein n=1 Tax=Melastoma candidum TaxID=119954 RepID=A0ACB9SDN4_9MYRT|nr:hypothetical protein MLD38_000957 [Melastoma candidum]
MSLLFLLYLAGSIQPRFTADARAVPGTMPAEPMEEERRRSAVTQSLIGSRPPSCDGRCKGCGRRCMAAQVPVAPQKIRIQRSPAAKSLEYARGDDISNYKPMTWKCRCGDIYYNP